jgi:hypothetical protein
MFFQSKQNTKNLLGVLTLLSVGMIYAPAYAGERESLEQLKSTTINLIELLVEEGVLPKSKADAIVKQATEKAAQQVNQTADADEINNIDKVLNKKDAKSVRVQYVPDHIKAEMRQDIEKEVMAKLNYKGEERLALPAWIDRFSFTGDIRLRSQSDRFSDSNASLAELNNPLRTEFDDAMMPNSTARTAVINCFNPTYISEINITESTIPI